MMREITNTTGVRYWVGKKIHRMNTVNTQNCNVHWSLCRSLQVLYIFKLIYEVKPNGLILTGFFTPEKNQTNFFKKFQRVFLNCVTEMSGV